MTPPRRYVVPPALAGLRLDQGLAELVGVSRRRARTLIDGGHLCLDGRLIRTLSRRLATGSVLDLLPPHGGTVPPRSLPQVKIVYEDRWLVALAKPAGVAAVAPRARAGEELTASEVLAMVLAARAGRRVEVVPAHRLDRATSGLLLFTRHARATQGLGRAFQRREVKKRYLAVVEGDPGANEIVLDQPIGRDPLTPSRFVTSPRGRAACTVVRALVRRPSASLLEVRPLTGRSHQIRVHLASAGWPILGDPLYGGATAPRLMLHAWRLDLRHPVSGAPLSLTAPLPPDYALHLQRCGLHPPASA